MTVEEQKAKIITDWLGEPPTWRSPLRHMDWLWSRKVLLWCIGENPVSPRYPFLRCRSCGHIRTSRRRRAECKCGGRESTTNIGTMTTSRALWALARGY